MREAPALAGATGSRPRPNGPRRLKPTRPKQGGQPSLLGRAFARPGVTICGASFAALMTGIVANAVLFQKGHHPAPLFSAGHAAHAQPAVAPPQPAAQVPAAPQPAPAPPVPAPAPAVASTAASEAAPTVTAAGPVEAVGHKKPAAPHKPATTHAHKDAIGNLIGSIDAKATTGKPTKEASARAGHARLQNSKPNTQAEVAKDGRAPHN